LVSAHTTKKEARATFSKNGFWDPVAWEGKIFKIFNFDKQLDKSSGPGVLAEIQTTDSTPDSSTTIKSGIFKAWSDSHFLSREGYHGTHSF